MLRDTKSYEVQIIDAVRAVNKALGGVAGGSRYGSTSDYNQYEVQLIDAIRGIARTLSGSGLSISGAGGLIGGLYIGTTKVQQKSGPQALTGITTIDATGLATIGGGIMLSGTKKIWFGDDFYIEMINIAPAGMNASYALHTNLPFYSDSWVAAGGVGSGTGGGGSSYLKDLQDVYHDTSGILRANGTAVQAGDALVYDTTHGWVASPGGGGGGNAVSVSQSTASGTTTTTITVDGIATNIAVKAVAFGTASSDRIPITIGATTNNVLTAHQSLSGYVPTSRQVNGHSLTGDITITKGDLGLGNVENTALSTWAGSENITTLGSITTGVWNGTPIGVTKGGTGLTSVTKGDILYASANNTIARLSANGASTRKFLTQTGSDAPAWNAITANDIPDLSGRYLPLTGGTMTGDIVMDGCAIRGSGDLFIGNQGNAFFVFLQEDTYLAGANLWGASTRADALNDDSIWGISKDGDAEFQNLSIPLGGHIDIGPARLVYDSNAGAVRITTNVQNNPPTIGLYADGYVAAGGVGSGSGGGGGSSTLYGLLDVSIPQPPYYANDGEVLAFDGTAHKWTNTDISSLLTGYATESWVQNRGYLTSADLSAYALKNEIPTTLDHIDDGTNRKLSNYLLLSGGTMTGAITMSGANILTSADSTNNIGASDCRFLNAFFRNIYTTYLGFKSDNAQTLRGNIGMGDGYAEIDLAGSQYGYIFNATYGFFHSGNNNVPCGRSDHRWSGIYGVDADLSGDLSLSSSSYIDLGPVRLKYEQATNSLHITSNNNTTINLYADGFVAAGGTGATS